MAHANGNLGDLRNGQHALHIPTSGVEQEILDYIAGQQRFVIASHARPDGDAIGSALATWQMLTAMGKHGDIYMADPLPVIYRALPYSAKIRSTSNVTGEWDAAIILECDSFERTKLKGIEKFFSINIDHHASAQPFASINWIDAKACATAEMIFRLCVGAGVEITPEIATCLYAAVLTDTGSFSYPGTTENTFALAQRLVEHGADPHRIAQQVYFSAPAPKMRLLGAALSTLHQEGTIAWMYVTRYDMERCQALDEDTEGLVNYSLGIAGVEVAVFFREQADRRFRVSLRSKGQVNVSSIAEMFGGGGHECASGCSIDGPLPIAADRILAQVRLLQGSHQPVHITNLA